MEPISHFFYSHRLKLQFWDFGQDGKPALLLVHGGLDHARNWDWVARSLREDYHVYALDLRYPKRVKKLVSIEGFGLPPGHRVHRPASERLRTWIETMRKTEQREPRTYPNLDAAVARMKEANPHLTDEVARHLTLHGTNWNADKSLIWKFDNYARGFPPYGHNYEDLQEIISQIECPVLLFWGLESWMPDPEADGRITSIKDYRLVKVPGAGHWVHHDKLAVFLDETKRFLAE